jgi:hypothetical protein
MTMMSPPSFEPAPQPRPTNGLGIAGFVISLVGLLGGCLGAVVLCPLGLILSAIGMRREPRGLAIAGLILGIIGSAWLGVAALFFGGLTIGALSVARDAMVAVRIEKNISDFNTSQNRLPKDLQELAAKYPDTPTTTKSGAPIGYTVKTANSYTLTLPGKDGQLGTADDVNIESTVGSAATAAPATKSP